MFLIVALGILAIFSQGCHVDVPDPRDADVFGGAASGATRLCQEASGSRIKLETLDLEGTKIRYRIIDALLGRCDLSEYRDSRGEIGTYCVPHSRRKSGSFYSDPSCTNLVFQTSEEEVRRYPYFSRTEHSCRATDVLYKVGPDVTETTNQVFSVDRSGACTGRPLNGSQLFELGERLTAEQMIAFSKRIKGSSRLKHVVYEGQDSSTLCDASEFYDEVLAEFCKLGYDTSGINRCLPQGRNVTAYFSDSNCSQTFKGSEHGGCDPSRYGLESFKVGCRDASVAYSFANQNVPGVYSDASDSTCSELGPTRAVLRELSSSEITRFSAQLDPDHGQLRLQRQILGSESLENSVPTERWWDSKLNVFCEPYSVGDSSFRCLPSAPRFLENYYSDSDCTKTLKLATAEQGLGCEDPRYMLVSVGDYSRVFSLVPFAGQAFVRFPPENCVADMGSHYLLGPEVSLDTFQAFSSDRPRGD